MDELWYYKNFNMVIELDIAGEFIYNGIHELYKMSCIRENGATFSVLYNISVGIERIQKIICVLFEADAYENEEDFEKSLITHSHSGLRDRINNTLKPEGLNIQFGGRENEFFAIMDTFYNHARYERFLINGKLDNELDLLRAFSKKYNVKKDVEDINYDMPDYLFATPGIKETIGRTVGTIAQKYYELVKKGSDKNHTFTYELEFDSKAQKIFMGDYYKNSLIQGQIDESIAIKELLVYFRKAKCNDASFRFIDDEVESLDFDPPLAIEYLEALVDGQRPQGLVDDVEAMYEEKEFSKDRLELMKVIVNSRMDFEYTYLKKAETIFESVLANNKVNDSDKEDLCLCKECISDDDVVQVIEKAINIIEEYYNGSVDFEEMRTVMTAICKEYKGMLY